MTSVAREHGALRENVVVARTETPGCGGFVTTLAQMLPDVAPRSHASVAEFAVTGSAVVGPTFQAKWVRNPCCW